MLIRYSRISTESQDHALQLDALGAAGCDKLFVETGSGSRADRAELAKLMEVARKGDVIVHMERGIIVERTRANLAAAASRGEVWHGRGGGNAIPSSHTADPISGRFDRNRDCA